MIEKLLYDVSMFASIRVNDAVLVITSLHTIPIVGLQKNKYLNSSTRTVQHGKRVIHLTKNQKDM